MDPRNVMLLNQRLDRIISQPEKLVKILEKLVKILEDKNA